MAAAIGLLFESNITDIGGLLLVIIVIIIQRISIAKTKKTVMQPNMGSSERRE
jgi:hypothetical protein